MIKTDTASILKEYRAGLEFKQNIDLFETVKSNENFFIGKQWEGVRSNGLPTPVFNFLKRVVLFTVASITSNDITINVEAANENNRADASILGAEINNIFDASGASALIREFLRDAAVRGDACLYTYWDIEDECVRSELLQNTRVFFGNVNERRIQKQPYIIVSSRVMKDALSEKLRDTGIYEPIEATDLAPELDRGDKATVLLKMWRDPETHTIWMTETLSGTVIRKPWDTGLRLYPLVWFSWDRVADSYHGQAMITGLIPNQIFINKLFAMSMISLMTTAYPKVVYDKTRIAKWDNRVGAAIGVNGGDASSVASIIDPAHISPQIAQFIELAVSYTQTFLGATPAALGDVRPDNTSAIVALQKASGVPNDLTRRALYNAVEELARIYADFCCAYLPPKNVGGARFDFAGIDQRGINLKIEAGGSSYWSEIAGMSTLDNLLVSGMITFRQYLERVPEGYVPGKAELLESVRQAEDSAEKPVSDGI